MRALRENVRASGHAQKACKRDASLIVTSIDSVTGEVYFSKCGNYTNAHILIVDRVRVKIGGIENVK
jgi:hypothetical protein